MVRWTRSKRLKALETVMDGLIELLVKKGVITRGELQNQIIEDANASYVERGGIVYKVEKGEEDE